MSREELGRGAFFMVASALLFATMSAAVKAAGQAAVPATVVVFTRNAVSLALLGPWLLARGGLAGLRTGQPRSHLVRGLAGVSAMTCFFVAIGHLRLADAVLLNYSLPLFLPLIERLWLGEAIPEGLWRPLGLGLVGLLFILKPGTSLFQPMALLGLTAAVLGAVAQVGVRKLTRSEPVERIVFYFSLIATAASAPPALATWRTPSPAGWLALAAAGLAGTGGQLLMTRAYAAAPAARVGPFLYTGVVFSGLLDWLLWHVLPDALFLAGALLVAGAAILALRLRGRARGNLRPAAG